MVARRAGKLRNGGMDLAAHCINDVLHCGADPLFLLDYVAANRIDEEQVAELVEGAAEVCRAAGCALIGGETAELPGIYRDGELDFAARASGSSGATAVDGSHRRGGRRRDGDNWPASTRTASRWSTGSMLELEDYDGDDLLAPTRLYLDDVRRAARPARRRSRTSPAAGSSATSAASLPDGLRAEIDWDAWERPPVFEWLARHVDEDELRRVFNLGIGWCAVVAEPAGDDLVIGRIAA